MLVKDLDTKYKHIECIIEPPKMMAWLMSDEKKLDYMLKHCELLPLCLVKEKYGDREVVSTKDYEDTHTTSVIIGGRWKERLDGENSEKY